MNVSNVKIQQVLPLISFELKLQWRKFISILIICITIVLFPNLFTYILNPNLSLPSTQEDFFHGNLMILVYVLPLIAGLLFSGIICSEYKNKTGLTLFPLISKSKILTAKYITNYLLLVLAITFYYSLTILFDYYFYAEWVIPSIFLSYGLVLLYTLALTSIICFFSSLLPSSVSVLLIELVFLLFGFDLISSLVNAINYQFEPTFSLSYLFNIVHTCLYSGFTNLPRYIDFSEGGNITRIWIYPTIPTAIIIFSLYFVVFISLSYLIFKKREL